MPPKKDDWSKIFSAVNPDLRQPVSYVTADQIKQITGHEPRIMAYMDKRESLPRAFQDTGTFLLPVSNGRYAIVKGQGFHDLEPIDGPPIPFLSQAPFPLETLNTDDKSESQHLDFAYHSRLLSDFTGAKDMHPTIRGRKYTGQFQFHVNGSPPIDVNGVQIEVDSGYESRENILLFECKAVSTTSFLIRQLYYPYRNWASLSEKPVRTFFFVAEPEHKEYRLWEYEWQDPRDYSSIRLRRSGKFRVKERPLDVKPFRDIKARPEASKVIPQANDVTKLLEFPFVVASGKTNTVAVAEYFDFDQRQSSYYREATEALGLVELVGHEYHLTERGRRYVSMPPDERTKFFLQLMLELPIVQKVLAKAIVAGSAGLSQAEIVRTIKENSRLTGTTLTRRTNSLLAWFREVSKGVPIISVRGRGDLTRVVVSPRVGLDDFGGSA